VNGRAPFDVSSSLQHHPAGAVGQRQNREHRLHHEGDRAGAGPLVGNVELVLAGANLSRIERHSAGADEVTIQPAVASSRDGAHTGEMLRRESRLRASSPNVDDLGR